METIARLKHFLALSRTPHGMLDMATPGLAALLYLTRFPSPAIVVIGLMTAFAGYTAIYAFNDIVDYRSDLKKCRHCALTGIIIIGYRYFTLLRDVSSLCFLIAGKNAAISLNDTLIISY